ncbi:MAG: M15 family metallopeptidase [Xanthomonadaceae bacterium]|nr:M15 family metallopeptidase [Xanthomonadaceae bacterium]
MTFRLIAVLLFGVAVAGCATAPPAGPVPPREPVPEPMPEPGPVAPETETKVTPDDDFTVDPGLIPVLADLGITKQMLIDKRLRPVAEATELVVVQTDPDGRRHELTPVAADAYRAMHAAAADDGIVIGIVSAFRSVARQVQLVRRKLDSGETIEQVLALSAPPGFSEHHSGRVVDLMTPGSAVLEADFADTAAYRWLEANAKRFGFVLSYPENNPEGYLFEPWHWRYDGTAR